ncbi:hypothetical protein DFP80_101157 [Marinomonas rhizomae]|uniref:Uncharacterized protein n=1 Tax=Marinomonas rhizomae TaxID=491948 RepID=A0A366JFA6_9GAMM|nr:hypothetical protein DFP80_101157 [Marinomonas rhizomae]
MELWKMELVNTENQGIALRRFVELLVLLRLTLSGFVGILDSGSVVRLQGYTL